MGKAVLSREDSELLPELRAEFERVGFLFVDGDYIAIEGMFADIVIHKQNASGDVYVNIQKAQTVLASLPDNAGEEEFWNKLKTLAVE